MVTALYMVIDKSSLSVRVGCSGIRLGVGMGLQIV